jgi:hypothetical protein
VERKREDEVKTRLEDSMLPFVDPPRHVLRRRLSALVVVRVRRERAAHLRIDASRRSSPSPPRSVFIPA